MEAGIADQVWTVEEFTNLLQTKELLAYFVKELLTGQKPSYTLVRLSNRRLRREFAVSAGALVLTNFGSEEWTAELYGSLSVASELAEMVKNRGQAIRMAYILWRLSGRCDAFLDRTHDIMEGRIQPVMKPEQKEFTTEQAQETIHSLRQLAIVLSGVYDDARRKRLTNNSLLGGPLSRLRLGAEEMLNIADWLDQIIEPAGVEGVFARAQGERERGEVFDLSHI